ncbi:uncharacterized protein LOC129586839 [Paramacrobiotus metropolitanus]|uniref:uncharacterized protein LOC129586839 n=1 Tax=Paramacrobiotus metropolitanus TaxID=2943436 RepID=UPI0024462532|nr:uncharacterized protein LOC129586839 [Paramacrobiotus metropolitanus]
MDYNLTDDDLIDAAALAALDDWVFDDGLTDHDMLDAAELAGMDDWVADEPQAGAGMPNDFRAAEHVAVEPRGHRFSKTHSMHFKLFQISVHDLDGISFIDAPAVIVAVLEYILDTVLAGVARHQYVRVSVDSAHLSFPIWTPPTLRSQLTVQRWMAEISKVLNSHQEFVIDGSFEVLLEHTEIPSGRCARDVPPMLYQKLKKMTSVILVNNDDEICMARALVIGRAFADGHKEYARHIAKGKREILALSKDLIKKAGLPMREYSLADIPAFENVLRGYQVVVVSTMQANSIVYSGKHEEKHICLLLHNRHFDVLTSMPAFFNRGYWCFGCNKGYNDRRNHRCTGQCNQCLRSNCSMDTSNVLACGDCSRKFNGQSCFDHHKLGPSADKLFHNRRSICSTVKLCLLCGSIYSLLKRKPGAVHRCGEIFCKTCREHVVGDHRCYMKPHKLGPFQKMQYADAQFLFFDFETYVADDGRLYPNLAVVQNDEGEEWIFPPEGEPLSDITDSLCRFLFSEDHRDHIVIAHNFKAFDGYFITNWLLKNGIIPRVIMNGGKIMQLDVVQLNIRFRDSINYNPQSLSKWPATFGIEDASKGLFPHRFNRPENWDQVTEFPSMMEYGHQFMSKKDREAFEQWYKDEIAAKHNTFDFRKEFVDYCSNDVTVLRKCCLQFRNLFLGISNGICPFSSTLTIAGLCGLYWRSNILKANQIGLIPPQGYHSNRNQSVKALKWLQWMELEENCQIQTRASGAEFKIGQYFVDGYSAATNTVFEFHGCWFHGCPECTAPDTIHPFRNLAMSKIYEETLQRDDYIQSRGYRLHVIWEHDFDGLVKEVPWFAAYIEEITVCQPINPRDAFYGGRTNATKLFHSVTKEEKIRYFDVCSEYPYVNKNKRYPIGHPNIIVKDFDAVTDYFGIIRCEVVPPADLYLPVLPYRSNGKLVFPLCRTCAETQQNAPCGHTENERALSGTWCTPEIHAAIDRGYVVTKVFEVWHFDQTEERLFAEYIDRFLKIKTEASGWPTDVVTDQQKDQYLRDFHEHEGIELDRDKMESNPGMRALAKLCLNSFWGRLGMQDNKPNTKYISSPEEFYRMLLSGEYHIQSWDMFSDDVLQLAYTKETLFVEQNPHTNVVLAAFTTCWARLHLYGYMEQVQDRLLYFDTDSIIFVDKPGSPTPPTGKFLGDLTDELQPCQFISQFVSLGPKTYSYKTNDGKSVVKVKGFTLNGHTSEIITFEKMVDVLEKKTDFLVAEYPDSIQRVKKSMTLKQVDLAKRLSFTYDKRRIVNANWNTLPYGYTSQ